MAHKKLFTLVALLLGASGLVSRWPGEKPPETPRRHEDVEYPRDQPVRRQEPEILRPTGEHAIVRQPERRLAWPPYGLETGLTRDRPRRTEDPRPLNARPPEPFNPYRFRPLSERERRRMEATFQGPYARSPFGLPDPGAAYGYPPEPNATDRDYRGYGFRPPQRSPASRGRGRDYARPGEREMAGEAFGQPRRPWHAWPHGQADRPPARARVLPRLGPDPGDKYSAR